MQAREQLKREPRSLPRLALEPAQPSSRGALFDLKYDSIRFEGYDPWPAIKAPVAV
jgi:thymidylate synthase